MSKKTRKSDSDEATQATEASAVELEESDLDDAVGGSAYLKLGDIEGESLKVDWNKVDVVDSLKIGDGAVVSSKIRRR